MPRVEPAFSMESYIPEGEAGYCLDCRVIFSIRKLTCPACGGDAWCLVMAPRPTGEAEGRGPVKSPQPDRALESRNVIPIVTGGQRKGKK